MAQFRDIDDQRRWSGPLERSNSSVHINVYERTTARVHRAAGFQPRYRWLRKREEFIVNIIQEVRDGDSVRRAVQNIESRTGLPLGGYENLTVHWRSGSFHLWLRTSYII